MKRRKEIFMLSVVMLVSSMAYADFSVQFRNRDVAVTTDGTVGNAVPAGTKVQLIWSAAGIQTSSGNSYNVLNGALLAGEILLTEDVTAGTFGFWDGPTVAVTFSDSDVGGASIDTGFVYARIFMDATGSAGSAFADVNEVDIDVDGYVFSSTDTSTQFTTSATGLAGGSLLNIGSFGTTVIPEPATIGLVGIAGMGLFLARRKMRG